jgi:hypothetical protein
MTNKTTESYGKNANRAQTERSFKELSRHSTGHLILIRLKATVRRLLNFRLHLASNRLNESGDDLVPTEGWGDRSQNRLHDVRIIGNT